jgi:hypothetical protein
MRLRIFGGVALGLLAFAPSAFAQIAPDVPVSWGDIPGSETGMSLRSSRRSAPSRGATTSSRSFSVPTASTPLAAAIRASRAVFTTRKDARSCSTCPLATPLRLLTSTYPVAGRPSRPPSGKLPASGALSPPRRLVSSASPSSLLPTVPASTATRMAQLGRWAAGSWSTTTTRTRGIS